MVLGLLDLVGEESVVQKLIEVFGIFGIGVRRSVETNVVEAGPGSLEIFFKLVAENENTKLVSFERK